MSLFTRKVMVEQFLPVWEAIKTRGDLSVFWAVFRDKFSLRYPVGTNQDHLKATMEWLCRAQDATSDGGISAAYDIVAHSWYPSYPETTGYSIPTFFDYAAFSGDETYRVRAIRMAEWLLSLQLENGAFPGPPWLKPVGEPVVFDTGQIIHGLIRAFEETGNSRLFDAALRAADWLVDVQKEDGSWIQFDLDHVHTYNARSAWALFRVHHYDQHDRFCSAGLKHIKWVLDQQTKDGWFHNASFNPAENPLTHTLAYTIEGLLEVGLHLSDQSLIEATCLTADVLRNQMLFDDYLKGSYGPGWHSGLTWSCLTGNAQMAIIWLKLFEIKKDISYLQAATKINGFLKQLQSRGSKLPGVRGGVAGSYPIYGDYGRYLYINWAAKFFADSLMLEEKIKYGKLVTDA